MVGGCPAFGRCRFLCGLHSTLFRRNMHEARSLRLPGTLWGIEIVPHVKYSKYRDQFLFVIWTYLNLFKRSDFHFPRFSSSCASSLWFCRKSMTQTVPISDKFWKIRKIHSSTDTTCSKFQSYDFISDHICRVSIMIFLFSATF